MSDEGIKLEDDVLKEAGMKLAERVVETLDGWPGTDKQRARITSIVIGRLTNYEIEKEDS